MRASHILADYTLKAITMSQLTADDDTYIRDTLVIARPAGIFSFL